MEERLFSLAREKAHGRLLKRFIRGIRYSLAVLDDDSAGLAFSFPEKVSRNEKLFSFLSDLPLPANSFLDLSGSSYTGDRCAAVAVVNALLGVHGDVSEVIPSLGNCEKVLMVGFIEPLHKAIVKSGITPHVIDDHYGESLPLDMGCRMASKSDLLILSASSVVNGTWQSLADSARRCWLVGPSAPLSAPVYKGSSVEYVLGRSINNIQELARVVARGGGTRDMSNCTGKISLHVNTL